MQIVTTSELRLTGPRKFDGALPRPPCLNGHYRDSAVVAFPTPAGDTEDFRPRVARVTASDPDFPTANLLDNDPVNYGILPVRDGKPPVWIQVEFKEPCSVGAVTLNMAIGRNAGGAEILVSQDGKAFQRVAVCEVPTVAAQASPICVSFKPVESRYFRIRFARPKSYGVQQIGVAEIAFHGEPRIFNWPAKTATYRDDTILPYADARRRDDLPMTAISTDKVFDLTARLEADGHLRWEVPEGNWTVLRVGHTTNGEKNYTATPAGLGPECNKMDTAAVELQFNSLMQKLVADVKPLVGKTLIGTHIDSWEVLSQNWDAAFRQEFQSRRKYDPLPYYPVLTGRIVKNREVSERFLWDFRRTAADLIAEKYFGHMRSLARKHGLFLSSETYGRSSHGNIDDMQCAARVDLPMGEFWNRPAGEQEKWAETVKQAASAAHSNAKPIVGAEAFTSRPEVGKWQNHPYRLKRVGDDMFCLGINRFIFHRYAMQPWLDRWPGMTMTKRGINYERTTTWFEQSRAWISYLARCQYLLQQGLFVGDACYFIGHKVPNKLDSRRLLRPQLPSEYDYDGCHEEVIMQRMSVSDGRVVLPDGMSYRVLVLPPSRVMKPELLRKLRELVLAGAQVVGPKPEKSPSLENYPACDEEVRKLADELWGDVSAPGEKAVGKGKVYWDQPLAQVLDKLDVKPDVEFASPQKWNWIHRRSDGADWYFLANPTEETQALDVTFRVEGKRPELWHPDTGDIGQPAFWRRTHDGRTNLLVSLGPRGSIFVVFRNPSAESGSIVSVARNGKPINGLPYRGGEIQIQRAIYGVPEDPKRTVDLTAAIAAAVERGQHTIPAGSSLGIDPAKGIVKTLRVEYSRDGRRQTALAQDGEALAFFGAEQPNPLEMEIRGFGKSQGILAEAEGRYDFQTAAGERFSREVPRLPERIELAGPWDLQFPKGWGAPEKIQFERLISWPEHPEEGVKYFSGTAVYRKSFELSPDRLENGRRLLLDLGKVAVIAEVKLNGKELGILWKPPFRVDVTDAVQAGKNELEVRVTNLWPNRLIGDERLPPYLQWDEKDGPTEWPAWVANGGQPPKTGRYTMTTWHHFTKDSPLLESGLLGPVTLQNAAIVNLPNGDRK